MWSPQNRLTDLDIVDRAGWLMAPRDWRDASAYAGLETLDLPSLAWEFLRRNPRYRGDWEAAPAAADDAAARWDLRFLVDPEHSGPDAPVFWREEAAPGHTVEVTPACDGAVNIGRLVALSLARREAADGLHLRLANGLQVRARDATGGPGLAALVPLDDRLPARLEALDTLERLLGARRPAPEGLGAHRRRRLVRMLRASDGRAAGASYREVALHVLGAALDDPGAWRAAPERDVAIRLCRAAARLVSDGYRRLLRRRR